MKIKEHLSVNLRLNTGQGAHLGATRQNGVLQWLEEEAPNGIECRRQEGRPQQSGGDVDALRCWPAGSAVPYLTRQGHCGLLFPYPVPLGIGEEMLSTQSLLKAKALLLAGKGKKNSWQKFRVMRVGKG